MVYRCDRGPRLTSCWYHATGHFGVAQSWSRSGEVRPLLLFDLDLGVICILWVLPLVARAWSPLPWLSGYVAEARNGSLLEAAGLLTTHVVGDTIIIDYRSPCWPKWLQRLWVPHLLSIVAVTILTTHHLLWHLLIQQVVVALILSGLLVINGNASLQGTEVLVHVAVQVRRVRLVMLAGGQQLVAVVQFLDLIQLS